MNKHSTSFDNFLDKKLQDPEIAKEFLNASLESYLEDGIFDEFLASLELVIKARQSLLSFSKEANLNRANLHALFKNKKKPRFETILKILSKLGYSFKVA